MDYDDQLVFARQILLKYPDILGALREQYKYICVDEAQDTSKIQHEIIRLLTGESGSIFMVGDEDQSIYGFRAAYPDALMRFEGDYGGARVLLLESNSAPLRRSPSLPTASCAKLRAARKAHTRRAQPWRSDTHGRSQRARRAVFIHMHDDGERPAARDGGALPE